MATDPQFAARIVDMARSLQQAGGQLMDRAQEQLDAGQIDVEQFFAVQHEYEGISAQGDRICFAADHVLAQALSADLPRLEQAVHDMEGSFTRLRHIQDILTIAVKVGIAVVSLASAILNPSGATIASAIGGLVDASKAVKEAAPQQD